MTKETTPHKEQSILDFLDTNANNAQIKLLIEGVQALYRERLFAYNVACSIAISQGTDFPERSDFELPEILATIHKLGMEPMPHPN